MVVSQEQRQRKSQSLTRVALFLGAVVAFAALVALDSRRYLLHTFDPSVWSSGKMLEKTAIVVENEIGANVTDQNGQFWGILGSVAYALSQDNQTALKNTTKNRSEQRSDYYKNNPRIPATAGSNRKPSPRSQPIIEKEEDWDLIIWSKAPNSSSSGSLPLSVFPFNDTAEDFVVSRTYQESQSVFLMGLTEVLRVDFRNCPSNDNGTAECPPANDSNATLAQSELEKLLPYQFNKGAALKVYRDVSNLPSGISWQRTFDEAAVHSIAFWSPKHNQYIPVHDVVDKGGLEVRQCNSDKGTCPTPCPQNSNGINTSPYPYLYDTKDGLCKSSDPSALPPISQAGGRCRCESTCFTQSAVDLNTSSHFPWPSQAERKSYLPYLGDSAATNKHVHKLRTCRKQRRESSNTSLHFGCPSDEDNNDFSLSCDAYGALEWHLYYIPKAKLIFCGVPKVGISEWIKFFRYVHGAGDYLSLPHYKEDRSDFIATSLPRYKLEALFKDPTWTKAVFLRNPYDRLLSAYSDKIVRHGYTQSVFKIGDKEAPKNERPILNFSDFVDLIADESSLGDCAEPKGLKPCTDPHWRPQLMTCGLDHLLPQFDFIGSMDHIALHTRLLLEKVGLWKYHGSQFDDGKDLRIHPKSGGSMCATPKPQRMPNETIYGFNQRGASQHGSHEHATGSKSLFDQVYTPAVQEKVRKAYAWDFAMWEDLAKRAPEDVASGKELQIVIDSWKDQQCPTVAA